MLPSLISSLQSVGPVPATAYERITAAWEPRSVAEGEFLIQANKRCPELFFIQQGVLRSLVQLPTGKDATSFFFREGQFCTVLAGFSHQVPTPVSIQAACPAQVLAVDRSRLDELCQQLPYLSDLLMQLIQKELLGKLQIRQAYLGQNAATRYQLFLRQQSDIAARVPQHMIASYLGITPQSLSRLRRIHS